jgi:hypothetical protein
MGLNGRRPVEEIFTWDIAARDMIEAYQRIIEKSI